MSAALGVRVDVLRRLIEHGARTGGANLDQQDADGCTALWWACCLGHAEAARLLMDSGARQDVASDWGVSPLKVAVRAGRRECVRLLKVGGDGVGTGGLGNPEHPSCWTCAGGVAGI
jgi:ankyrin repeat protein